MTLFPLFVTIPRMTTLTGNQRRWLAKKANSLKPQAQLGKKGLSPEFIDSLDKTLEAHELIKLRFLNFKEDKEELTKTLCIKTKSCLVRITGNVALIYRPCKEEDDRAFKLPEPKKQ